MNIMADMSCDLLKMRCAKSTINFIKMNLTKPHKTHNTVVFVRYTVYNFQTS